ncbi:MAG: hypothetical protein AB1779_02015, partial [Candidatus Thermoplasmatota archaeon]
MNKNILILLLFCIVGFGVILLINPTSVNAVPLSGANANLDSMKYYDAYTATYTTYTAAANDDVANDFSITGTGTTLENTSYYGMNYQFKELIINVGTAGAGGVVAWEYYSSDAIWVDLEGLAGFSDGTVDFTAAAGTYTVAIPIPSNWTTTAVDTVTAYWVRARVTTLYTTAAVGTQASTVEYNLKIKAQDELTNVITGLAQTAFNIKDGTDNTIFAFREIGSGVYEFGLYTAAADVDYNYNVTKDGYVNSTDAATGVISTTLTDRTATPDSLPFTLKVLGVTDELGNTITPTAGTPFISIGGSVVDQRYSAPNWYVAATLATTSLNVSIDGYVNVTVAVTPNSNTQTTVDYDSGTQFSATVDG